MSHQHLWNVNRVEEIAAKHINTYILVNYNQDGSVGYVSGSLVPVVTKLAAASSETQTVRCCDGLSGETREATCQGESCSKDCGAADSGNCILIRLLTNLSPAYQGCITLICEECSTRAEHQVCDASMQQAQWCTHSDTRWSGGSMQRIAARSYTQHISNSVTCYCRKQSSLFMV